jgi:hypothetical protein
MKKVHLLFAICMAMSAFSCSQEKKRGMNDQARSNNYPTPEAALAAAKANLPILLNEGQKRSYGLESEEQIKNLSTTHDLQWVQLPMNQLRDTVIRSAVDARIYTLGQAGKPSICVSVNKSENNWVVNTIGMKKYVNAVGAQANTTAVVEALGLELSFLEVTEGGEKRYRPIVDYPEAKLAAGEFYTAPVLLQALEDYRAMMEKLHGKAFSAGELDR